MSPEASPLHSIRFAGDRQLFRQLREGGVQTATPSTAEYEQHKRTLRKRLLSSAVRVDPVLLPKLDASIRAVRERASFGPEIEAYVFDDPSVNAFFSEGQSHTFLGLSSGAVNTLSSDELEFVIGHELGHAVFEHIDAQLATQLNHDALGTSERRKALAWKRACEISADRCGLVCCGSLEAAATAVFRTLSGITLPSLRIDPTHFSKQWDHLLDEVIKQGADDTWETTHPFPPLRIKAMTLFWESDTEVLPPRDGPKTSLATVDEEIARLLSTMDPQTRSSGDVADPLLEDVLMWAGMALTRCDPPPHPEVAAEFTRLVPSSVGADPSSHAGYLTHLQAALDRRAKRLSAGDINRIFKALLTIAYAKGSISEAELACLREIGALMGIAARGVEVVHERFCQQRAPA